MSRILLVAEAAPSRDALAKVIRGGPHTVRAVAPGDLALESARDWDPDIIVMDLSTNGATVPLRMGMLRDPNLADIPFIALGDSEDEARALGAHAFARTGVTDADLLSLVSRVAALRFPLPQ